MNAKPRIKPELKDAWEKTNDFFLNLLSGRQKIEFSKIFEDGELKSFEPVSPPAVLSKMMIMSAIPSEEDKEEVFISLVSSFASGAKTVVSSLVDKDLDGTKHFHRSSIEVEDTPAKFVLSGVKLEK